MLAAMIQIALRWMLPLIALSGGGMLAALGVYFLRRGAHVDRLEKAVDRLPRRPLYVAACGAVLAACGMLGPQTSFRGLLFLTFLIGFGAGFYETVLNALVIEAFGEVAPRRLVFIHSAATLAAALTPLFFDALREVAALAWYDTFHMAGALHGALIGRVGIAGRQEQKGPEQQGSKAHRQSMLTQDGLTIRPLRRADSRASSALSLPSVEVMTNPLWPVARPSRVKDVDATLRSTHRWGRC